MKKTQLDIFSYIDFKQFIEERLLELKDQDAKFSRRYLIRRMGLANSNYLKMIIDGKRPLTLPLAQKLARELGLDPKETAFFLRLLRFAQADTGEEKAQALCELRKHKRFARVHALALRHLDYMTDPLLLTLRELVALPDFKEDAAWILPRLTSPANARAIERGLAALVELGLLQRDKRHRLRQTAAHQSTGAQLGNVPLRRYHKTMLALAASAQEQPVEQRSFSGLSFSADADTYGQVLARYAEFLDEVRAISDAAKTSDRVYHLECVLFPLAFPPEKGE